ncbi:unnamed protein product [Ectocarpus fasciculatus]
MYERRAPDDGTRVLLPFPLSPPVAVEEGPGFPDVGPRQWYRELLQLHRLAADGGKSTRAPAPAARRARRPGKPNVQCVMWTELSQGGQRTVVSRRNLHRVRRKDRAT